MNYCNFSQFRNRFNRYSVIFSSKYILDLVQTRYDELFHKHLRLKYGSIPNDLYFQNIRAFQMVNGFHLLISKTRLISFETRNICYIFKNNKKHKDKKIFDSLDKYHLHNFELDHVDVVEDLDDLFCIDVLNNTASISIYFQPPTSHQECYDGVLLEKNQDKISVILFQLTISAEHYFNIFYFMIFVEKYMKCKQEIANCIWDIEFWVVTSNIGIPFKFTSITGFDDNMKFIRSQCLQIKKVFKKLKYTSSNNSKSVTARKKRMKCDKKNLFGQKQKDRIEATKLFCELTQRITFRFSGIITSIKSE
ncbi:hypothetical protein TRFO_17252 [Tritrichomonas foetus]|uniref:Uncharacterized protein n=1 Tax=Tritrichomonas foetus TaxID=1144522 RepID=A0A1J4KNA1_9EUKA|nr:hypothetical protein TRFO_17252 [Tritrichomonas foetus]|eukprot:OHT12791.1 hypothetical protein TRFO_17252 [Tritrichomonas foetus]